MKCPVHIKEEIFSPRRTTRFSMQMPKTNDVLDESTRNACAPSMNKKSTKEPKKSAKKNKTTEIVKNQKRGIPHDAAKMVL